ncbi:DUF2207 domain-containing protein [Patescibacteria group bacterium]|nr:DUF2207 domain-containing protein [Patescibacteria group bacterium]
MSFSFASRLLTLVFAMAVLVGVAAPVRAEEIKNFAVEATLDQNRRLTIEETLDYDFGYLRRHGLLRTLPERYRRQLLTYDLHYTVEGVTMDGREVPWQAEDQGADLVIRVGDPIAFVTGTHRYVIRYRTDRAINDFSDSHELYWNVTGHDWPIAIDQASFVFSGISTQKQACYTGRVGSTDSACSFRPSRDPSLVAADAPSRANPHEGFTVVLEFPKGSLKAEPLLKTIEYLIRDNFFTFLPLLLALLMFVVWYLWGRDPRGRGVIIPQYEAPDKLTPALMAGLVDQDISSKAMTAAILDLARRGHAKVILTGEDPKEPEKVLFRRVVPAPKDSLAPYEQELMKALLDDQNEVNLRRPPSQAQQAAYQKVVKAIMDDMLAKGWFLRNPEAVRGGWITIAFFIGMFAFIAKAPLYIVLAGVVALCGWQMPRMTRLAAEVCERVLGFKRFLSVTEKARLAFSDAPAKRPEQFAEFLPAAVALGVEKEWAKQFEGLLLPAPDYIQGTGRGWTGLVYIHALGHVTHSVTSSMSHQTKAGSGGSGFRSGGGFSGGGFGGGGGGSW